jgi:hypothetical protein
MRVSDSLQYHAVISTNSSFAYVLYCADVCKRHLHTLGESASALYGNTSSVVTIVNSSFLNSTNQNAVVIQGKGSLLSSKFIGNSATQRYVYPYLTISVISMCLVGIHAHMQHNNTCTTVIRQR